MDLSAMYAQLTLYSGGMTGHSTPTILPSDETDDLTETGRSGAAIGWSGHLTNLHNLLQ